MTMHGRSGILGSGYASGIGGSLCAEWRDVFSTLFAVRPSVRGLNDGVWVGRESELRGAVVIGDFERHMVRYVLVEDGLLVACGWKKSFGMIMFGSAVVIGDLDRYMLKKISRVEDVIS
jgi:hypothetical protein